MHLPLSSVSAQIVYLALLTQTFALPVQQDIASSDVSNVPDNIDNDVSLVARAGNGRGDTEGNAVEVTLDTNGHPSVWEFDCYAILCLGKPRTMQLYRPGEEANRRASGADDRPFQDPQGSGTSRPDADHNSAEEYPWASTRQGGAGAELGPATRNDQNSQGGRITAMYGQYRLDDNQWFRVSFSGYVADGYCAALMKNPPDTSICQRPITRGFRKAMGGYDPGDYVANRTSQNGAKPQFSHVGKWFLDRTELRRVVRWVQSWRGRA